MIKNAKKITLVGIGEILWDILPGGRQLGGVPANFAYHAQVLSKLFTGRKIHEYFHLLSAN